MALTDDRPAGRSSVNATLSHPLPEYIEHLFELHSASRLVPPSGVAARETLGVTLRPHQTALCTGLWMPWGRITTPPGVRRDAGVESVWTTEQFPALSQDKSCGTPVGNIVRECRAGVSRGSTRTCEAATRHAGPDQDGRHARGHGAAAPGGHHQAGGRGRRQLTIRTSRTVSGAGQGRQPPSRPAVV